MYATYMHAIYSRLWHLLYSVVVGVVSLQQKISLIYFLIVCVYCEKEDRRQCCYVFLDACLQSCGEIGRAAAIRANTLCFVVDFWIIAALRRQQIYSDPKHTLTLCI